MSAFAGGLTAALMHSLWQDTLVAALLCSALMFLRRRAAE